MKERKSYSRVFFGRIIGILIFLVLIGIANYLIPYINNNTYSELVVFFDNNLLFLIIISIISLIGDLFFLFIFPFDLIAPIFRAIAGVMIAIFIFRILMFIDGLLSLYALRNLYSLEYLVYVMVFIIVLVVNYVIIFKRLSEFGYLEEKKVKAKRPKTAQRKKGVVTWEQIGDEYKLALYNLGKALSDAFSNRKKKR